MICRPKLFQSRLWSINNQWQEGRLTGLYFSVPLILNYRASQCESATFHPSGTEEYILFRLCSVTHSTNSTDKKESLILTRTPYNPLPCVHSEFQNSEYQIQIVAINSATYYVILVWWKYYFFLKSSNIYLLVDIDCT